MRIGELSRHTGASVRSLRYYEQQGLLSAARTMNGYREYTAEAVETVATIRSLLELGLTTALLQTVLPCTTGAQNPDACDGLLEQIALLRDRTYAKAEQLHRVTASLDAYLRASA